MPRIVTILVCYFIIGGICNWVVTQRSRKGKAAQLWLKYFMYLLIVSAVMGVMLYLPDMIPWMYLLIVVIGFMELLKGAPLPLEGIKANAGYIPLAVLFCLGSRHYTPEQAAVIYMTVLSFDGFCQISGQLLGGRKLMKKISPEKTIAGLAGGSIMALLTIALLQGWQLRTLATGLFIICCAFTGDTLASWLKRRWDIKDYSNTLPGHGGFLDRFDSLIMTGAGMELLYHAQNLV